MRHHLICPTWRCWNHCRYCWMAYTVRARTEMWTAWEREPGDWIAAINREPVFIDIAGGEPLLYEGLRDIIEGCPDVGFGLSTNGMHTEGVKRLCASRLPKLGSVNLSIHSDCQMPDYIERYKDAYLSFKAAGYPTFASIVKYPGELAASRELLGWLRRQGAIITESPYEDMKPESEPMHPPLICDAGVNGLVVAPDGMAWPCLGGMWSKDWQKVILGNWLDDTVDVSRVPKPCHMYCESYCYLIDQHSSGDMWNSNVRVYQGADR